MRVSALDRPVYVTTTAGQTRAGEIGGYLTTAVGPHYGSVESGLWVNCPSIFRLLLKGTGSVVMDARNDLGDETSAVESYSPSGATNQIEYPYAGDDAVQVRFTITGSCSVEII